MDNNDERSKVVDETAAAVSAAGVDDDAQVRGEAPSEVDHDVDYQAQAQDEDDSVRFGEVIGQMKQDLGYFGGVLGARIGGAWAALQIEDSDDDGDNDARGAAQSTHSARTTPAAVAPPRSAIGAELAAAAASAPAGGLGLLSTVGMSALKILTTEDDQASVPPVQQPMTAPTTAAPAPEEQVAEESDAEEPENEFEETFDEQGGADYVKELERRRGLALRKIREIDTAFPKDQIVPGAKSPTEKVSARVDSVLKVPASKEDVDKNSHCVDIRDFAAKARAKASTQADEYRQSMVEGDQDSYNGSDSIKSCCASCRARMDKLKSEASTILAILVADVVSVVAAFAEDDETEWLTRGKGARSVTDVGRAEANEVSLVFVAFLDKIVEATATRVADLQAEYGDGMDDRVMQELERRRDKIHGTIVQATTSSSVKLRQCLASITPILRLRALQDLVPTPEL